MVDGGGYGDNNRCDVGDRWWWMVVVMVIKLGVM